MAPLVASPTMAHRAFVGHFTSFPSPGWGVFHTGNEARGGAWSKPGNIMSVVLRAYYILNRYVLRSMS